MKTTKKREEIVSSPTALNEYSMREILKINDAFKGLANYATQASFVVSENHLKVEKLAEDAARVNKAFNKQYCSKDELGNIVYDDDDNYAFTGKELDELNEAWDKYLDETKHKIAFIPMAKDIFKVRVLKQGRHDYVAVELPPKFITPLIGFGIIVIPDKGPNEGEPV